MLDQTDEFLCHVYFGDPRGKIEGFLRWIEAQRESGLCVCSFSVSANLILNSS